jgi:hypothetical protein
MKAPFWAQFRRVDEMIECYPISEETQRALLEAMPDAYGGEAPGEDDWPEPDAARDEPYKLSKIWDKLAQTVQEDLLKAWEEEHGK